MTQSYLAILNCIPHILCGKRALYELGDWEGSAGLCPSVSAKLPPNCGLCISCTFLSPGLVSFVLLSLSPGSAVWSFLSSMGWLCSPSSDTFSKFACITHVVSLERGKKTFWQAFTMWHATPVILVKHHVISLLFTQSVYLLLGRNYNIYAPLTAPKGFINQLNGKTE